VSTVRAFTNLIQIRLQSNEASHSHPSARM